MCIYLVGCILSEAVWPEAYGASKLHSQYLLAEEEAASAGQVSRQVLQTHQILHNKLKGEYTVPHKQNVVIYTH